MADAMVVVSCEHGGHDIPAPYGPLFKDHQDLLTSHRGFDPGALALARRMADTFGIRPVVATTSRLLVDLNRSQSHPQLFSHITRSLEPSVKELILLSYYRPYRNHLQNIINAHIQQKRIVVHIASHSFTPVLKNKKRLMDVGLLYDPKREAEKRFCRIWKKNIRDASSSIKYTIRSNAPYKGISDGIPASFRKLFSSKYIGIELELNQQWYLHHRQGWKALCDVVLKALRATVTSLSHTV